MGPVSGRETCSRCGKTWGVNAEPREDVLCSECARTPKLPEGEVRTDIDGTMAVCLGGSHAFRWKVIGEDPHGIVMHGWRADWHVIGWAVLGNVRDLKTLAGTR